MTEVLTADRVLDTAEDVLRRFGPSKATVVDVARALGVSHGSVYRHFASKADLRDAVARRWLERITAPLSEVAAAPGPADEVLCAVVEQLSATKRRLATEDPELFATFHEISVQAREVVAAHLETLAGFLADVIARGVASGELVSPDPTRAGRAVLQATARFHHPAHAAEWADPALEDDLRAVLELLLTGLRPRD